MMESMVPLDTLLKYLKDQELLNTAVFIVRYYGEAHLGPDRFQIIMKVAKDAHDVMLNASFETPNEQQQQDDLQRVQNDVEYIKK